jgi:CRP-like cAMP-binding protein
MSNPTVTPSGELHVPKGTTIFRQGDPGNEMFVVAEGAVRLTLGANGSEREIAVFRKGEFFGELSLLTGAARSASAEAVEDSVLLTIGRDAFAMMVQDDIDIVFRMMHIQAERLSRTNRPIEELTRQVGRIRILAEGLRRFLCANQSAVAVDLDELSARLQIGKAEVVDTVAAAARGGGGTLAGDRWHIAVPQHAEALSEALCDYAAPRGGAPGE